MTSGARPILSSRDGVHSVTAPVLSPGIDVVVAEDPPCRRGKPTMPVVTLESRRYVSSERALMTLAESPQGCSLRFPR